MVFLVLIHGGQEAASMPNNPLMQSLRYAVTTSFGSICYGSLFTAAIQTLRWQNCSLWEKVLITQQETHGSYSNQLVLKHLLPMIVQELFTKAMGSGQTHLTGKVLPHMRHVSFTPNPPPTH
ncbi:hypothetical protein Lser_V15G11834 [Lactuca serriola]